MADLEFDRAAVKVSAKKDWEDAQRFAAIGSAMAWMLGEPEEIAPDLPVGDNDGTSLFRQTVRNFVTLMRYTTLELSDACAVLGSGQEDAIADMGRICFLCESARRRWVCP